MGGNMTTKVKTIKKASEDAGKKKADGEPREYAITESFTKGEIVYHKIWDDTGEILEIGITDDGISKMKVAFEKVGVKSLRMG